MKPGYTFAYRVPACPRDYDTDVTIHAEAPPLSDLVEHFKCFLLANGFQTESIEEAFAEAAAGYLARTEE